MFKNCLELGSESTSAATETEVDVSSHFIFLYSLLFYVSMAYRLQGHIMESIQFVCSISLTKLITKAVKTQIDTILWSKRVLLCSRP